MPRIASLMGFDIDAPDTMHPVSSDQTRAQVDAVVEMVRSCLGPGLEGMYLQGSAVQGGLRASSDLDLLVVSRRATTPAERRTLIERLLPISGSRAVGGPARSIELTIVVRPDVVPWRHPPPLDFQYGDWWRTEFEAGDVAPWQSPNADLTVLLASARRASAALIGPPIAGLLDPIPRADLERAMRDGVPGLLAELDTDTRNVILTLVRIWATLVTGDFLPKDMAADWALPRLPEGLRPPLVRARAIYLGDESDRWSDISAPTRLLADHLAGEILDRRPFPEDPVSRPR